MTQTAEPTALAAAATAASDVRAFPHYPAYRESGFFAAPTIPSHWHVERFQNVTRLVVNRNRDDIERPMLSLSAYRGVEVKQYDSEELVRPKEESLDYLVVEPNQLVLNPMWVIYGSIGVSRQHGIVSPAYRVYAIDQDNLCPAYSEYLLGSVCYLEEYSRYVRGLTTYDRSVRKQDFHQVPVLLPPLAEQRAIAAFLDRETARIDTLVAAKRRMIELLREKRAALISRAVTRGLDASVPLRESGVPWLGAIPEGWAVTKISRICMSVRDGTHAPPLAVPGIHRLLSARNIVDGAFVIRDDDRTMAPEDFAELERSYTVRPGDVVMAIVGATTGKSAIVGLLEDVSVQRSIAILRPDRDRTTSNYLNYWLQSAYVQGQIQMTMDKYAAQPGIYLEDVAALKVPTTDLAEQYAIVAYLDAETAKLDALAGRIEQQIARLREYRTALIAAAVTGAIDVRGHAAGNGADGEKETAG